MTTRAIILISVFVIAAWVANLVVMLSLLPDWESRGQAGDLFGASNALFSGLAFAGLIYAIVLQSHELSLQREELKLQREEMAKARAQMAEQARIQEASLKTQLAQLRISNLRAEIAAIEMESEAFAPGAKSRFTDQIRAVVNQMRDVIAHLVEAIQPK